MNTAIWISLVLAVGFVVIRTVYIIFNWNEKYGYWDDKYGFGNIGSAIFASLFIFAFSYGICWCVDWIGTPIDHYESHNVRLYGLSNKSGTTGSFILGSGTIDNQQYIFYNAKESSGYIKTYKVLMDDCRFDNQSDSSYLEIQNGIHNPRFGLFNPDDHEFTYTRYVFHLKPEDMNITNYYDISKY